MTDPQIVEGLSEAQPENPPAFPEALAINPAGDVYYGMPGMTLRDWFAGQALRDIMTDEDWLERRPYEDTAERIAIRSYKIADAMLAARSKHHAT